MQLNTISCLHRFMGKEQKEALINGFIFSSFNYCPLVWHFCSCKSSQKIGKIQIRCLRIIYNDYSSDYKTLLKLSQKPSMEIKRLRNLTLEIFKTINDLTPSFMKSIFSAKLNPRVRPNDILVKTRKSASYPTNSKHFHASMLIFLLRNALLLLLLLLLLSFLLSLLLLLLLLLVVVVAVAVAVAVVVV